MTEKYIPQEFTPVAPNEYLGRLPYGVRRVAQVLLASLSVTGLGAGVACSGSGEATDGDPRPGQYTGEQLTQTAVVREATATPTGPRVIEPSLTPTATVTPTPTEVPPTPTPEPVLSHEELRVEVEAALVSLPANQAAATRNNLNNAVADLISRDPNRAGAATNGLGNIGMELIVFACKNPDDIAVAQAAIDVRLVSLAYVRELEEKGIYESGSVRRHDSSFFRVPADCQNELLKPLQPLVK